MLDNQRGMEAMVPEHLTYPPLARLENNNMTSVHTILYLVASYACLREGRRVVRGRSLLPLTQACGGTYVPYARTLASLSNGIISTIMKNARHSASISKLAKHASTATNKEGAGMHGGASEGGLQRSSWRGKQAKRPASVPHERFT